MEIVFDSLPSTTDSDEQTTVRPCNSCEAEITLMTNFEGYDTSKAAFVFCDEGCETEYKTKHNVIF